MSREGSWVRVPKFIIRAELRLVQRWIAHLEARLPAERMRNGRVRWGSNLGLKLMLLILYEHEGFLKKLLIKRKGAPIILVRKSGEDATDK